MQVFPNQDQTNYDTCAMMAKTYSLDDNNNVLLDAEHEDISASCSIVRTVVKGDSQ